MRALETGHDPGTRLAVEVDEHVATEQQVERRLAERRIGVADEVVLRQGNQRAELGNHAVGVARTLEVA